jgi:hypothetical protein
MQQLLCPFFEQLTDDEHQYAFFSKDSTAIYTAWASLNALKTYLGTKLLAVTCGQHTPPQHQLLFYFIYEIP